MNIKHLPRQFIKFCLVFILIFGMVVPANAAPAETRLQTGPTLPRTETLYFNGLQWGAASGWNPYSSGMNNSLVIAQQDNSRVTVFETPYMFNMIDGKQYPLLADGAWAWNLAHTEVTFKIKSAAKWNDGTPVTAYDVAYTWASNAKYGTDMGEYYKNEIDTIQAVDAQTVRVKAKLDAGKAVNPIMVEAYLSTAYVIQKAWTQKLETRSGGNANVLKGDAAEDVVSSGPYKKLFRDDTKVVLIRDDNYWGKDASMWGRLPAPKYLAHEIYADNAAGDAAFKAAQVDVSQQFISNVQDLWLVDHLPISTYYPDAPYSISASMPTAFYRLTANGLDNAVVRKAIAMAVDYDTIIANAMNNQSPKFTDFPRSLMAPTAAEQAMYTHETVSSLQWDGNDVVGANALLDGAGIVDTNADGWREYNGTPLSFVVSCPNGWTDWMAAVEVIAAAGAKIGIQLTTNYPEWGDYAAVVTNSAAPLPAGYDIFMMWTDGVGPSQPWSRIRKLLSSEYVGNGNNWNGNWGQYSSIAVDNLIQGLPAKTDPTQIKADYTELVRLYLTDVPSFTLMYRPQAFHTVNETYWTGFPHSEDGYVPAIPPLDLIDGYSIAGLYKLDASPTVTSINRLDANPNSAASVRFGVTFSESVTGVDAGDFILTKTGISGTPVVTSVTGSGKTYIVTASTSSGSGSLRLDVIDNDTIKDLKGNPLGGLGSGNGGFTLGQAYDIRPPAAFGKTSPANGSTGKATT